ncbi:MAG: phosphatidate cytidylyltransferase [Erythrobacter sp.]
MADGEYRSRRQQLREKVTGLSDLPMRLLSAILMLAIAVGAVLLGGYVLQAFIVLVALAACFEFFRLIWKAYSGTVPRVVGALLGVSYFGIAVYALSQFDVAGLVMIVGAVIAVDVFAYFFGRAIGGPKIAPRISPSKTWAGLLGGIVGVASFLSLYAWLGLEGAPSLGDGPLLLVWSVSIAVIAQAGDFLESWMKRRANVKDSSNLIPGHGGVFDRVDGLAAVAFVGGLLGLVFA